MRACIIMPIGRNSKREKTTIDLKITWKEAISNLLNKIRMQELIVQKINKIGFQISISIEKNDNYTLIFTNHIITIFILSRTKKLEIQMYRVRIV